MSKYNGWTNYATWRVNLEVFDGYETDYPLTADGCQEMAEELIWETSTTDGIARNYALAFLSDVDWQEIADHVNEANALTVDAD